MRSGVCSRTAIPFFSPHDDSDIIRSAHCCKYNNIATAGKHQLTYYRVCRQPVGTCQLHRGFGCQSHRRDWSPLRRTPCHCMHTAKQIIAKLGSDLSLATCTCRSCWMIRSVVCLVQRKSYSVLSRLTCHHRSAFCMRVRRQGTAECLCLAST